MAQLTSNHVAQAPKLAPIQCVSGLSLLAMMQTPVQLQPIESNTSDISSLNMGHARHCFEFQYCCHCSSHHRVGVQLELRLVVARFGLSHHLRHGHAPLRQAG